MLLSKTKEKNPRNTSEKLF